MNRTFLLKLTFCKYLDSKQIFCVSGRHKSITIDIIEYEKRNLKTNKIVKVRKGKLIFVVEVNRKFVLSKEFEKSTFNSKH